VSVSGAAIAMGALAKGVLTAGFVAGGNEDYFLGCDCMGAEAAYTLQPQSPLFDRRQYWTSVAAGLTVAAILAAGGTLVVKGRR
jgi:hypothetical protein